MKFVEDLRAKAKLTKSEMGRVLGRTPQAYRTLVEAKEQLTTKDITMLRRHFELSDTELLDLIEAEFKAWEIRRANDNSKPTT